ARPPAGRAGAPAQAPAPVRLSLWWAPGERGPGRAVRAALGAAAAQQLRVLGQRLRAGAVAGAGGTGGRVRAAGDVLGGRTGGRPARSTEPGGTRAPALPRDRARVRPADAVPARPPAAQPAPAAGVQRPAVRRAQPPRSRPPAAGPGRARGAGGRAGAGPPGAGAAGPWLARAGAGHPTRTDAFVDPALGRRPARSAQHRGLAHPRAPRRRTAGAPPWTLSGARNWPANPCTCSARERSTVPRRGRC